MMGPLILIVFVAGGDADDPTVRAMVRTTGNAVAGGTRVEVRDMHDALGDAEVVAAEESAHADAVVELSWKDAARREALVRVRVAAGPWVERTVRFAAGDADIERGRTLGFAIASVLPEREEKPESAPPLALPAATATRRSTSSRPVRLELDALASSGVTGSSAGFGGEASAGWQALGPLELRAAAGILGGGAGEAFVSTIAVRSAAGLRWDPLPASESRRWEISVAADWVVERLSVTYSPPDSPSSTQARWLTGAGIGLELRWRFASNLAWLAGVSADDVFSPTYVVVRGQSTLTLPAVRGIGRLGLAIAL